MMAPRQRGRPEAARAGAGVGGRHYELVYPYYPYDRTFMSLMTLDTNRSYGYQRRLTELVQLAVSVYISRLRPAHQVASGLLLSALG